MERKNVRRIRKGDLVEVISGDEAGTRGNVHQYIPGRLSGRYGGRPDPNGDRVVVAGVNLIKKHQRRTGDVRTQFGIIEREAPIHASKVALVCPHCKQRTRVGFHTFEDGSKTRVCKKCGEYID